jgi:hypothetical protein
MPRFASELVTAVNTFFDDHTEQLTRRSNGMMEQLYNDFCQLNERNCKIRLSGFKRLATQYRTQHHIDFVGLSKYYKPKIRPRTV